jgi:hypothetical protein
VVKPLGELLLVPLVTRTKGLLQPTELVLLPGYAPCAAPDPSKLDAGHLHLKLPMPFLQP